MRRAPGWTRSTCASLLLATGLGAVAGSAHAGDCNTCAELPMLYRELMDQETLLAVTRSWIAQDYYPASISEMKRVLVGSISNPSGAGGASAGGGEAAPAFGIDMASAACALVAYVEVRDRDGNPVKDKDGKTKYEEKPITDKQVRARHCKPVADFLLAHEGHHRSSCKTLWGSGRGSMMTDPGSAAAVEFFVKDDAQAYEAGVAVLRRHIADLALRCGWDGSTNRIRPDGLITVPTPPQIEELRKNIANKARNLERSTRRRSKP